jgi:hypothetical protein
MLRNLLAYCAAFEPVRREARVVLPEGDPRAALLESVALSHQTAADPLATLVDDQVAVVDASPANLAALADARDRVEAFCRSGGWLMLWGLGPDGLEAFNRLVGHNHVLRPFEPERVLLETPLDPIASGLTLRDVVMDTGERMYGWMALMRPDTEAFSYLVDHLDIAPFATFPSPTELGKPSDDNPGIDHFPRNMVNGFTSDDNWAFTYTIMMDRGDAMRFTLELPKEEEITALRIRPSKIYHPITKMKIYFDDDPEPVTAEIPVREQPVVEDIPIAGRRARRVTLEVAEWEERGTANIVVIDNLWLQVRRDEDYMRSVRSILNIGGLMVYRIGDGGIVLNQLRILERERNPINADKKAAIVRTMLGNAGAVFVGGRMIVAGGNVAYHPLRIPDAAFNAYADRRGQPEWFRGPGDLGAIPVGEQRFGDGGFLSERFPHLARAVGLHARKPGQHGGGAGNHRHRGGPAGGRAVLPAHGASRARHAQLATFPRRSRPSQPGRSPAGAVQVCRALRGWYDRRDSRAVGRGYRGLGRCEAAGAAPCGPGLGRGPARHRAAGRRVPDAMDQSEARRADSSHRYRRPGQRKMGRARGLRHHRSQCGGVGGME